MPPQTPLPAAPGGASMFDSAKVDIQGGEFINANRDVIKLVINPGHDVMETIRAALPILLEEVQKIQSHATSDGKTGSHDTANDRYLPPEGSRDPVIIDKAASGLSSLLETGSIVDRYTRSMLRCLAGYPLYVPQPYSDLSEGYSRKGICVGDVGIITKDGVFDFLFSICLSQNGSFNPRKLPSGFTLEVSKDSKVNRKEQFPRKTHLFESSVIRKKSLFRCTRYISSEPGGAILELPEGAFQDDATSKLPFRKLAVRKGVKWYKYTIGTRGRDILNGSLYLVTSCTKCTQWGIAVFDRPHTPRDGLRFVQSRGLFRNSGSKYSWKGSSTLTTKVAPQPGSDKGNSLNQCVFVQGYKIMLRQDIFDNLMNDQLRQTPEVPPKSERNVTRHRDRAQHVGDGAKSNPKSRSKPIQDATTNYKRPTEAPLAHPSDLINTTLLNQLPNAKVAVTHDDDWCYLIQDIVHDPEHSGLAKIARSYTSAIDKYGSISFERIGKPPVIGSFGNQNYPIGGWTATPGPPVTSLSADSDQIPVDQTRGQPWNHDHYPLHHQTPMHQAVRNQPFSEQAPLNQTRGQQRVHHSLHQDTPAYQMVPDQPFSQHVPFSHTRGRSIDDRPPLHHQAPTYEIAHDQPFSEHASFSHTRGRSMADKPPVQHHQAPTYQMTHNQPFSEHASFSHTRRRSIDDRPPLHHQAPTYQMTHDQPFSEHPVFSHTKRPALDDSPPLLHHQAPTYQMSHDQPFSEQVPFSHTRRQVMDDSPPLHHHQAPTYQMSHDQPFSEHALFNQTMGHPDVHSRAAPQTKRFRSKRR